MNVNIIFGVIKNILNNIKLINIIEWLLGLDTLRAIIAFFGWFKPESKIGRIIYGKYENNLMALGLKELGFSEQSSKEVLRELKRVPNNQRASYGITKENAPLQLIILIAKYIVRFDDMIQYGGRHTTHSQYYIDTMEMSHSKEDCGKLAQLMASLYQKKGNRKKPDVVITNKGGNPFFARAFADLYGSVLLIAKSSSDKSRLITTATDSVKHFSINYEGSWSLLNSSKKFESIVVDCNASGGSQLLDIVRDIRDICKSGSKINIIPPEKAFILFCADTEGNLIDDRFKAEYCQLFRYFDLDEEIKGKIFQLGRDRDGNKREPDLFVQEDNQAAIDILNEIKNKNYYHY